MRAWINLAAPAAVLLVLGVWRVQRRIIQRGLPPGLRGGHGCLCFPGDLLFTGPDPGGLRYPAAD
jgi:hypothetical protein